MIVKKKFKKIICVITHKGNAERIRAIKETWLSKPLPADYLVLFVYGNDGGVVPRLEGSNLYLPASESWNNLPNKIYELYLYCFNNFEFEHIFKIDDDGYVHPHYLLNYPRSRFVDYAGRFIFCGVDEKRTIDNNWAAIHGVKPYLGVLPKSCASGPFYILSSKVVRMFILEGESETTMDHRNCQTGLEDLMIASAVESLEEKYPGSINREDWGAPFFFERVFIFPNYKTSLTASQMKAFDRGIIFQYASNLFDYLRAGVCRHMPGWLVRILRFIRTATEKNKKNSMQDAK